MWKVSVTNSVTSNSFGKGFETESEADSWIAEQEAKQSWGKDERWVRVDSVDLDGNLVLKKNTKNG